MTDGAEWMLVVDDDPTFREVLGRAMRRRGFDVREAAGVEEALSLIGDAPPSRAVVDLRMPGASGLKLVEALRRRAPHSRIVVLTGYASIATAIDAMKLGATHYLAKPADADEIVAAFGDAAPHVVEPIAPRPLSVDRLEWEHIQRVLAEYDGNISATARALGMHRRTLQRKLGKNPPRE